MHAVFQNLKGMMLIESMMLMLSSSTRMAAAAEISCIEPNKRLQHLPGCSHFGPGNAMQVEMVWGS